MSNDLVLDALKDYQNAQKKSTSGGSDKAKYLITSIGNDKPVGTTITKKVRIVSIPVNGVDKMFATGYFHSVQVDGQYRKVYDPDKNDNGEPSPLTDAAKAIFEKAKSINDEEKAKKLRQLGGKYLPDLYYIFKVVERGAEGEGPVFWRFKHNQKGDGAMDKIMPLIANLHSEGKPNLHDVENGRDITLTFKKVSNQTGNGSYTKLTSVLQNDPSPLSDDPAVKEFILADTKTWTDAYKKYPTEYLSIIASGGIPMYDKDKERYVEKTSSNSNSNPNNIQVVSASEASGVSRPDVVTEKPQPETVTPPITTEQNTSTETSAVVSDDDLPF